MKSENNESRSETSQRRKQTHTFFRTELLKITCSCECFTLNEVNVSVR